MAHVPYLDPEDLPEEERHLLASSDDADRPANVFRAMANNPAVLDSFRKFYGIMWQEAGLSPRERELVILTVARTADSTYEWHQHVRIGRGAGLDDEEIEAVGAGDLAAFTEREALAMRYARAVVADEVDDDLHATAAAMFDDVTLVGLAMLASGYFGLSRALAALDVDIEEPFVGWALDGE